MCLCLEPLLDQSLVLCLGDIFFWLFTKECNWSHTLKRLVLAPSGGRGLYSNSGSLTTPSLNYSFNPVWCRRGGSAASGQDGYTQNKSPAHHKVNMEISNHAHTHHPIYDQFKCMSLECGRKSEYLGRTRHKDKTQEHANSTQKGLGLPEGFEPLTFLV